MLNRARDIGSGTATAVTGLLLNPLLPKSVRPAPPLGRAQLLEMVFVSSVTAALSAMARPQVIEAAVVSVMDWFARMLPANCVPVPRVAELPTWKNTPV